MKKIVFFLLAAVVSAGCEKDDPMRYDMTQGRVCFPGATQDEATKYPGYSSEDQMFHKSMTFKQQPAGAESAVVELPVKLIGMATPVDRKIGCRILDGQTTASPEIYSVQEAVLPAGKDYGVIRIRVDRTPQLDTVEMAVVLELTASEDLKVGLARFLKARVAWHNMLPRPVTNRQWATYNAFIGSELPSASKLPDAYSQAGHQLLVDAFGWETIPDYGSEYDNYIEAWRAKLDKWYEGWKSENPGKSRIHETGSMKGQEVKVRDK